MSVLSINNIIFKNPFVRFVRPSAILRILSLIFFYLKLFLYGNAHRLEEKGE